MDECKPLPCTSPCRRPAQLPPTTNTLLPTAAAACEYRPRGAFPAGLARVHSPAFCASLSMTAAAGDASCPAAAFFAALRSASAASDQGLTLVHFSAQLERFL